MFYQNTYIPGPYKPDYYTSVDEANADIVMQSRYPGMSVYIIDTSNILTEYWYKDDISDGGLIPKILSAPGTVTVEEDPVWEAEKVNYYEKTQVDTLLTAKADLVDGIVPSNQLPDMIIPHHVTNYSALPDPTTVANQTYFVLNSQGTKWLPGSLGGTYYPVGIYYSDGTQWIYMGEFAYQATQSDTNAEANNTNFVTPFTLGGWATQKTFSSGDLAGTVTTPTIKGGVVINDVSASAAADFANRQLKIGALISIDWSSALKLPQLANSSSTSFLQTSADGTVSAVPVPVTSVLGRTGNVAATDGDYDTSLVTENGNLYFLNSRAIGATLTAYAAGAGIVSSTDSIISAIQKLDGNIGGLVTGVSSFNTRAGAVTLSSGDVTGALGFTPMNGSATLQTISNNGNATTTAISAQNYIVTGTTGSGYIFLPTQTVAPTTPIGGDNLYHLSTGLTWMGASGFSKTFSGSGLTASRVYTLPDANGTLALAATTLAGYGITDAYPLIGNPSGFITSAALPISANPSASVGLTAVNGTATTFMTSDSAPALDQTIAPTWTGVHTFDNTVFVNNSQLTSIGTFNSPTSLDSQTSPIYVNQSVVDTSTLGTSANIFATGIYLNGGTVSATNAATYSGNLGTVVISSAPTAGTNVTFTGNQYALSILTGGASINGGLTLGGNVSKAAWGATGVGFAVNTAIYTDTSTAASGTVSTTTAFSSFATPTLATTNTAVTYNGVVTNVYIAGTPIAGSNVTIPNLYAMYVAAGTSQFQGNVVASANLQTGLTLAIGTTTGGAKLAVAGNFASSTLWGANGIQSRFQSATYTDNITAASGTVSTTTVFNSFATPTLAATNTGVTYSGILANVYIASAPIAGTNVTATGTLYALYAASGNVGIVNNLSVGSSLSTVSRFSVGSGLTIPQWGTNGPGFAFQNATFTDSSTAASGTVAATTGIYTIATPVIAATNTNVTYSGTVASLYLTGAPIAGTNVTFTGSQYALYIAGSGAYVTHGLTVGAGGNTSAWGINGPGLQVIGSNYTDTSTAASATVSSAMMNTFGTPTIIATNTGVTYTTASTVYINAAPAAGTNVTITNPYALIVNTGNTYLGGGLLVGSANTAPSSGNLIVAGVSTGVRYNPTNLSFASPASGFVGFRNAYTATTAQYTLTANDNYAQNIFGYSSVTTAATGTHAMLANVAINPLNSVTSGGATVTTTASLYVNGAGSGGSSNYAYYSPSGNTYFGGRVGIQSTSIGNSWLTVGGTGGIAPWGTTGSIFNVVASTITDNSTAASGTVSATTAFNSFGIPTLAATNTGVIYSGAVSTVYIGGAPTIGSNVTLSGTAYALYVGASNVYFGNSSTTLTVNRINLPGNSYSTGIIGTAGNLLSVSAGTITDTFTAASGTVANYAVSGIGASTLAASNTAITYTNAATFYIAGAPTTGTNVAITNPYSLYVAGGNTLFASGTSVVFSTIVFGSTNSSGNANFLASGGRTSVSATDSKLLFGGATTVNFRGIFNGDNASGGAISVGSSYSNVIVGSSPITTAASGTHSVLANLVVNPLGTVTSSGATVTTTATLYVNGAGSGGSSNYSIFSPSGNNYLGGSTTIGLGLTVGGATVLSGNMTLAAWGTTGVKFNVGASTFTDNSTAASGTVSGTTAFNTIQTPTLAATNTSVTYSGDIATWYVAGAPTVGTNITSTGNLYASYINSGDAYFGGYVNAIGGIHTGSKLTSNLFVEGGTGAILSQSTTGLTFGGSLSVSFRTVFNGSTSTTLASGNSYSNVIVGSSPITTFTSGTHSVLANMVVNPIGTVTSGGATVTTTATLYVNGSGSGGTSNYALFSSGTSFLGGRLGVGTNPSIGSSILSVGYSNLSQTTWGTLGAIFNSATSTITDNSTAASGTVSATTAFNSFQTPTLAATNTSVTYSGNVANVYIAGPPTAGTNVTFTGNPVALYAGGQIFSNYTRNITGTGSTTDTYENATINLSGTAGGTFFYRNQKSFTVNNSSIPTGGTSLQHIDIINNGTVGDLLYGCDITIRHQPTTGSGTYNYTTFLTNYVPAASSTTVNTWIGYGSGVNSLSTGTLTTMYGFYNPAITVTNSALGGYVGLLQGDVVGATGNVYGYYNTMTAGTNKYAIYVNGTAQSSIGGKLTLGVSSYNTAAWGTTGSILNVSGSAITDNSTAASGTVSTNTTFNSFQVPTLAAANTGVIYSGAVSTVYISGAPTIGSNVTLSGTAWAFYVNAGNTQLGGNTLIGNGAIQGNARLSISAGPTGANTTTTGVHLAVSGNTYTDNSTAVSGTATWAVQSSFGVPIFNSTNTGVTYTNAATVLILGAPTAGANATITNPYALYVAGGQAAFLGGIATSAVSTTSNFYAAGGATPGATGTTTAQFASSTVAGFRTIINGTTTAVLNANSVYANLLVGSSPITTFTSGTHSVLANLVVNPLGTVTSGGATVTLTASLYVNGAGTGGTSNYGIYVSGATANNLGSGTTTVGTLTSTARITTTRITAGGIQSTGFAGISGVNIAVPTGVITDTTSTGTVSTIYGLSSILSSALAASASGVTYTTAASLYIDGAPTAGTNVTAITNPYSLYINSGNSYLGGGLTIPVAQKVKIATGTNAIIGQVTLVAGTVTVSTTSVTASSLIFLTISTIGGTPGFHSSTIVAGTSFTINSTSSTDTSIINWWIVN